MAIPKEHVEGEKKRDVTLYALSTCGWCRKTKELLNKLGIDYYKVDVDLLEKADKDEVVAEVKKWNPACSFPTMVIDNDHCIVGYDAKKIEKELG